MMTHGLLKIEKEEKDDVVGMTSFQGKKVEMCKLQYTKSSPPKFILTKLVVTYCRTCAASQ